MQHLVRCPEKPRLSHQVTLETPWHSLEVVRVVHVLDVMNGLIEVISRVLHLRQLPRRILINGGALHLVLVLLPLHLERDVGMSYRVPSQGDDALQLFLGHGQHELVDFLGHSVALVLRHREAPRALHQDHVQLLQDSVDLFVEHPFELYLLEERRKSYSLKLVGRRIFLSLLPNCEPPPVPWPSSW